MDQELVQYLDQRFQTLDQRFDVIDQRFQAIDQRFEAVDQKLESHDRRFERLEEQIRATAEETKRHTGVLVEGLRHELHLVAEGLIMHVEVRHREDREYFDRKFEDLGQRVDNLERRQQN